MDWDCQVDLGVHALYVGVCINVCLEEIYVHMSLCQVELMSCFIEQHSSTLVVVGSGILCQSGVLSRVGVVLLNASRIVRFESFQGTILLCQHIHMYMCMIVV